MEHKRLLIFSHNCLSKTGSNGRTLANYLRGWPKEKLAQFYMHPEQPDRGMCENYFCLPDTVILRSILKRRPAKAVECQGADKPSAEKKIKVSRKKNSAVFLVRDMAWKSPFWDHSQLDKWVAAFAPECILVQAGDAGFLFRMALRYAKRYKIPIIVYNTEGYYFKKVSYLPETGLTRLFYPLVARRFRKDYDRLVRASSAQIYNCQMLRDDYEAVYGPGAQVIMSNSDFTNEPVYPNKKKQMVYAGNLSLNRHRSLIELACAVGKADPDLWVDVYGKAPNAEVQQELESCPYIRLHGFIPYEQLQQILRESRYLVHVESFDDFYKEDLKYAVSTKIADSLASGSCLVVYAPENMAVSQYLADKNAALLICQQADLNTAVAAMLEDEARCNAISSAGRKLAEANHNMEINREKFQKIVLGEV